jgi:hypothetical protein
MTDSPLALRSTTDKWSVALHLPDTGSTRYNRMYLFKEANVNGKVENPGAAFELLAHGSGTGTALSGLQVPE